MDESYLRITPHLLIPISELTFRTSRSSGPGGQNVNKLETKVEVLFDVRSSRYLSAHQKDLISDSLAGRIDEAGILHLTVQQARSQYQNKELARDKLVLLLRKALQPKSKRIRTKPSKAAKEKRMRRKKLTGEKKAMRRVVLE